MFSLYLTALMLTADNPYRVVEPNPYSVVNPTVINSKQKESKKLSYQTRNPTGHTHTCQSCNITWDHRANPTHNCELCGRQRLIIDIPSRPVTLLSKEKVNLSVSPFLLNPFLVALEDNRNKATGPWPESLDFPEGMVPYKRGTKTQKIYTVVNDPRDHIDPVDRYSLPDTRWHQSGGMLGVEGYRSDVYRYLPEKPEVWIGDISVLNSLGYYQNNRGWRVNYPDGSRFMDVLSNTKLNNEVFEIRQRTKKDGKWESLVIYENEKVRPAKYTGLTVSCASCHKEAGTGGYAVGLAPGGDGVLSTGFTALEE